VLEIQDNFEVGYFPAQGIALVFLEHQFECF